MRLFLLSHALLLSVAASSPLTAAAEEPSCRARLEQALSSSQLGLKAPLSIASVLFVTLPDPVATPAAVLFDSMVEALISELSQFGYARERMAFPWPELGNKNAAASGEVQCPGLVLFRALPNAAPREHLVVLIIPESSTLGINKAAFAAARELLVSQCMSKPLRVLGPFYSGSAQSLHDQLLGEHLTYRMASGSLSVTQQASLLDSTAGTFQSFASSLDARRKEIREFLGYSGSSPPLALLQESGTLYGQSPADGLMRMEYPPNLSELRKAYADLPDKPLFSSLSRTRDLPYRTQAAARPDDVVPVYAPQDAQVTHDLSLRATAEMLAQRRIGDIVISGVLPQDRVFLAQHLKKRSPDLRVIFDQMGLV